MLNFTEAPPLSLYIHLPWCVRKCPYCDFNSHELKEKLPQELYVNALLAELDSYLPLIADRPLISIFFGGGTPSLFSGQAIANILQGIQERMLLANDVEITLEANPGTMDQAHFYTYREAGINRISIGIQSLQNEKLKVLGRIHDRENALRAIAIAKQAGFTNFNLDIMFGLPQQSVADAMSDLCDALSSSPTHFSWYQLTIEPNTFFAYQTPELPDEDTIWNMQMAGQDILRQHGFQQYEVSAYALPNKECRHNRHYWEFGDYLGIGAGAHSKITQVPQASITRFSQVKHPRDYLDPQKRVPQNMQQLSEKDIYFEFMLNALRLTQGTSVKLFEERTGLPLTAISSIIEKAKQKQLLLNHAEKICASSLGQKFLNDLTALFL
jgi:putative oxygen-independent coproporphyrinogen III oxidase